jgi:hypothetical protein
LLWGMTMSQPSGNNWKPSGKPSHMVPEDLRYQPGLARARSW